MAAAKKLLNHGDKRVAFPPSVDKLAFANQMGSYFVEKIHNIHTNIENMGHGLREFEVFNTSETTAHLSNFNTITEEDVRTLIKECGKKNTRSAVDPMPTSLVIDLNDVLLPTITKIINQSLDSGTFAYIWKCALVHPLLKTVGVDPLFVNCRPISNLQYISKLTEKVVFSQTHSHMTAHSLYPELQSSYRRYHRTETALLKVTNDILLKMNSQEVTLLVTLDLRSAFDTVNHQILLRRLQNEFGNHGKVLDLAQIIPAQQRSGNLY